MSCTADPIVVKDPRVGDVGTALVVQIVNQCGDVVDVSAGTGLTIYLQKPDGTVLTKTAVLDTTGLDGMIRYNTIASDFSAAGLYKTFGRVTLPTGGPWSSIDTEFLVQGNWA